MSIKELLREFKAMRAQEQKEFLREVRQSKSTLAKMSRTGQPSKKAEWPDVERRAKRITGERILPNLVLVERDDSAF